MGKRRADRLALIDILGTPIEGVNYSLGLILFFIVEGVAYSLVVTYFVHRFILGGRRFTPHLFEKFEMGF
ncbi:hypothetical protein AKJ57_06525, partial [candidate division MSBL1 archaeon SCGC-AAA259A05]